MSPRGLNPLMGRQKRMPVEKMEHKEKKRNKKTQKEKKSEDRKMWIHLYTILEWARSL
jgi:hypothetical protein